MASKMDKKGFIKNYCSECGKKFFSTIISKELCANCEGEIGHLLQTEEIIPRGTDYEIVSILKL